MDIPDSEYQIYLVMTTEIDKKKALKIAKILLREKLIACLTYKKVESRFWWKEKISRSKEVQLIMKCKKENINVICKKIIENHSYELPEIIYFPVSTTKDYYHWVNSF